MRWRAEWCSVEDLYLDTIGYLYENDMASDNVIIAAITGLVSVVSLLITLLIKSKVDTVGKRIDGRMDELLALTRSDSKQEGKLQEKAEHKEEEAAKQKLVVEADKVIINPKKPQS